MKNFWGIKVILLTAVIFGFWIFLLLNKQEVNKIEFIKYPAWDIELAFEKMPQEGKYYVNKQRFDKNFLVVSYNLYQNFLYKKRANLYFPYIEEKLEEAGIPDDFKYLAVAESAFKNDALSTAQAWWIWQFMPDTARRFWLTVDEKVVDERYNFEASTQAAIKYLEYLYEKFWNRTLVAAAYNRWENWLERALKNQWVESYYDLRINSETADYVFRILWVKYSMLALESLNTEEFDWWDFKFPEYEVLKFNKIDSVPDFCKKNKITQKEFYEANPWVIWNNIPDIWKTWEIKIVKKDQ